MFERIEKDHKVKTRTKHICFACQHEYYPGTEMFTQVNKLFGDLHRLYYCLPCNDIMREFEDLVINGQVFSEGCVHQALPAIKSPNEMKSLKQKVDDVRDPKTILSLLRKEKLMEAIA